MRRSLKSPIAVLLVGLLAALMLTLAVAGCGSSASSSASDPIATELSYVPAGSPYVLTVATDPNSPAIQGIKDLIGKFPLAGLGLQALNAKLDQLGVDYSSEIKPLLGNPLVFAFATGVPPSNVTATNTPIVAAWVTKSASVLKTLIKKAGVSSAGTRDGASLYEAGGAEIAVDGATVVVGTHDALAAALDRHAHGGGFSTADYQHDISGLPQNAVINAFGNLGALLSAPSAAAARQVPWVAAIRGYGVAVTVSGSGIAASFRVDTSGRSLSASQLPLSSGPTPSPAGPAPLEAAIHNPSQLVTFAEAAAQTSNPTGYQHFLATVAKLKSKLGIDIDSLAHSLTGDMSIASDTHVTAIRAQVSNPTQVARALSAISRAPRSIIHKPFVQLPGGFYSVNEGTFTLTVGLVGDQLVAGRATPAVLRSFAAAKTAPVAGAQGSFVFRIGLLDLVKLALRQTPPPLVQPILNSLGDLTGWISASPSALTGEANLAVK
jgi:hypothetical protein